MAQLNTKPATKRTHEGAPAKHINALQQLRRSVLACMLWEREFYEDGQDIATRIAEGVKANKPEDVIDLADEARNQHNLRHAPLLLLSALEYAHRHKGVKDIIPKIVNRADELAELISIHCRVNGVGPDQAKKVLGAQMKKGLAEAFRKFDAYQLAKYNRGGVIKLRDVLFMVHAKPKDAEQEALWKQLVDGALPAPDTWEVALSTGGDKKTEFERLLNDGKMGYMALLRNLRNMVDAGVDKDLIRGAIRERKGANKVLPFRFVAAARHAPQFERDLDDALIANIQSAAPINGHTVVLVDVSASMSFASVSRHSEIDRMVAAATLASVIPSDDLRVFSFSNNLVEVPPRKGMSGVDAIVRSQNHAGTNLGQAVKYINDNINYDRLIVVTDEQSADRVPDPVAEKAYMINVASNRNGVGYGKWIHIDGFSESVIKYIQALEHDA